MASEHLNMPIFAQITAQSYINFMKLQKKNSISNPVTEFKKMFNFSSKNRSGLVADI